MQVGVIGLGKMGMNLSLNMIDHEIEVYGYDKFITTDVKKQNHTIIIKDNLKDLIETLKQPRILWLMVPSGTITKSVIEDLIPLLDEGDIVIDGGNSRYTDTLIHYELLQKNNIHLLDCGTSGGVVGARHGASFMIGGDKEIFDVVESLFSALAVQDGYAYMGKTGAGHFVKMVHNGIEYGMMQAIGEGFDILEASPYEFDYQDVSQVWSNGSIIEGLLMRMVQSAFSKDAKLDTITGRIDDSGEGKWTIEEALNLEVSVPVIAQALFTRYKSRDEDTFAEKLIAAMRNEFGGHKVYKK